MNERMIEMAHRSRCGAPGPKHTLTELACHCREGRDTCYASTAMLAYNTGYSVSTVKRHLRSLLRDGLIEVVREHTAGGRPTKYRLLPQVRTAPRYR